MFSRSSRCISSLVCLSIYCQYMLFYRRWEGEREEHLLHEIQHDSLRDHVDHGPSGDIEVGVNKQLCLLVSMTARSGAVGYTY